MVSGLQNIQLLGTETNQPGTKKENQNFSLEATLSDGLASYKQNRRFFVDYGREDMQSFQRSHSTATFLYVIMSPHWRKSAQSGFSKTLGSATFRGD
jgi:hypothetical protein